MRYFGLILCSAKLSLAQRTVFDDTGETANGFRKILSTVDKDHQFGKVPPSNQETIPVPVSLPKTGITNSSLNTQFNANDTNIGVSTKSTIQNSIITNSIQTDSQLTNSLQANLQTNSININYIQTNSITTNQLTKKAKRVRKTRRIDHESRSPIPNSIEPRQQFVFNQK
jgi:hypothetical protein